MAARRQRQVADLIQEEISELLTRKTRDPRMEGVTVTEVKVSPDLRFADIYVSKLGDDGGLKEALVGLSAASGYLKRELGPRLNLRFMPDLRFHADRSWEQGARIDALLRQLAEREQPTETEQDEP